MKKNDFLTFALAFVFAIVFVVPLSNPLQGQSIADQNLLQQGLGQSKVPELYHSHEKQENTTGLVRSLFAVYQRRLTKHMASQCPYAPSCSEFGRLCFEEYGQVKALSLAFDRLSRCNKIVIQSSALHRHTISENKILDPACDYK